MKRCIWRNTSSHALGMKCLVVEEDPSEEVVACGGPMLVQGLLWEDCSLWKTLCGDSFAHNNLQTGEGIYRRFGNFLSCGKRSANIVIWEYFEVLKKIAFMNEEIKVWCVICSSLPRLEISGLHFCNIKYLFSFFMGIADCDRVINITCSVIKFILWVESSSAG